jgi:hypothetical protein
MIGLLAWFVNIYNSQNLLTPQPALVLFIVSVLGCIWAVATLFTYHRSKAHSLFVALIDTAVLASLIAAAYLLRAIGNDNCAAPDAASYTVSLGLAALAVPLDKACAVLKAAWALAILNCICFAVTALLALTVRNAHVAKETTYVRESHYSRHGHRRSGSRRSHRSSRDSRRGAYV